MITIRQVCDVHVKEPRKNKPVCDIYIKENQRGRFNLYLNTHHYANFGYIWTALRKAYEFKSNKNVKYYIHIVDKDGLYHGEETTFFAILKDKYREWIKCQNNKSNLEEEMADMFD